MDYALQIPDYAHAIKMHVHDQGDEYVSASIREKGIWEPFETQLFCRLINPADTVLDVGANIAYYSLVASPLVGSEGQVFAFEPEPNNFALVEKNIALNGFSNITAVNAGLADKSSAAELYLSDDNYGDHQIYDGGLERNKVSIELLHGDSYFADKKQRIDVIKIDTQGAEYVVIGGLQQLLKNSLPDLSMIIEFWPYGLRKAGYHAHDLLDMLLSLSLPMYIIDHIDHKLIPCQESDLRPWIDDLDKDQTNEGFLNLFLGESPYE